MKITARHFGAPTAALLLALTVTGCGAIAEEAFEQAVESEAGGDVEIDFDGDDGTFSIEGENGESFSIDVDENSDDGEAVISSTDEDGNTFEMATGADLPDNWPGELPVPPGTIASSTVMGDNDTQILTLVMEVDDSEKAHDDYVDELTSSGFTVGSTSSFESDGQSSKFTEVTSDKWNGMISSGVDSGGPEQLVVNFQSATP